MFLIFDLDDTLIPTTEWIAPIRLRRALERMQKLGLQVEDFEETMQKMIAYNQIATGSEVTLQKFWSDLKGEPHFLEAGREELLYKRLGSIPVPETNHTEIKELASLYKLAIVTKGRKEVQEEKIDLFQIPREIMESIVIVEEGEKKPHYARLTEEKQINPKEVVAIGDRITVDLKGAKEMGFHTVHMRQGRGKGDTGNPLFVDYTIDKLSELKHILQTIRVRNRV